MKWKIYIASKTKHADKWLKLREGGVNIISTWIDEAGQGESKDLNDLCLRCIKESKECDAMIVYAEPGDYLKGAFIEMGVALSVYLKPIYLVGEVLPIGSAFTYSHQVFSAKTVEEAVELINTKHYKSSHPEQGEQGELYRRVTFNDDFDCVADLNTEPIYLKLVRNIAEISDEQILNTKEIDVKPSGKERKADSPPEGQNESRLKTISLLQSQLAAKDTQIETLAEENLKSYDKLWNEKEDLKKEIEGLKERCIDWATISDNKERQLQESLLLYNNQTQTILRQETTIEQLAKSRDHYKALAEAQREVLEECEQYFDNKSDADFNGFVHVPNTEMRILSEIQKCLQVLKQTPITDDKTQSPDK